MSLVKKLSILFVLQTLLLNYCLAQHYTANDSMYVFSLLNNAEVFFSAGNYDSALSYSGKAMQHAQTHNFRRGIAYSLMEQTDIHIDLDNLAKADNLARQSYSLGKEIKDSLIMAVATMQMAQTKMYANDFVNAISIFEKCIPYFSRHPSKYAALAYNDFGYTYGRKSQPQMQAECFIKALEIYDKLPDADNQQVAVVLSNLSSLYYSLGQREKAIEYGEKSILFRKKTGDVSKLSLSYCNLSQIYLGINHEKAKEYLELGVKYAEQSGDETRMLSAYISSSLMASSQKDFAKSLAYEKKAIALLEKNGKDSVMLSRRYIAVGIDYQEQGDSLAALDYFERARHISMQIKNVTNLRDAYYHLTRFYKHYKNYEEAYNNYKNYIHYRDTIVNEHTNASIAEIETKYQTAKKDNEITRLNADQRIKALQIEKQDALLAGNKLDAQRKEKEIELLSQARELQDLKINQQNELLEKQQLLAKNNAQQLQLAEKEKQLQQRQLKNSRTIRNFILGGVGILLLLGYFLFNRFQLKRKIREQEALLEVRSNIAKDLHDEVGSALTSIKILSEVSGKHLAKDQAKTYTLLQKITEQSTEAQQGISDIVWSVKPENDKMENMVIRMREYIAHTLESKNIQTSIDIDEKILNQTLGMAQRRDLLMIFKEVVNNITKYADATHVHIQIEKTGPDIHLKIADDGKGFDPDKQTSSSGLKNIRSRAESLNGRITITSGLNKGTSVDLFIPTT